MSGSALRDYPDELREKRLWEGQPDQRGVLIFQHDRTPEPWPAGAVLWLRAGALQPELLVLPQESWVLHTLPRAGIMPIGIANSDEGHALFVYAVPGNSNRGNSAQIMAANLDNDGASRHTAEIDKGNLNIWFWDFSWIVGGNLFGSVEYDYKSRQGGPCTTVTLMRVDNGAPVSTPFECLPGSPLRLSHVTLSHDGRTLGMIVSEIGLNGTEPFRLTVIDLVSGQILEQGTIDIEGYYNVRPVAADPQVHVEGCLVCPPYTHGRRLRECGPFCT
jgi:hypothetical protein